MLSKLCEQLVSSKGSNPNRAHLRTPSPLGGWIVKPQHVTFENVKSVAKKRGLRATVLVPETLTGAPPAFPVFFTRAWVRNR